MSVYAHALNVSHWEDAHETTLSHQLRPSSSFCEFSWGMYTDMSDYRVNQDVEGPCSRPPYDNSDKHGTFWLIRT